MISCKYIAAMLMPLLIAGCGSAISTSLNKFVSGNDFALSYVSVSGAGIADGSTDFQFSVVLKNSNGSYVNSFIPQFSIVSGEGVTSITCASSNSSGVSNCSIKATTIGVKRISISNISVSLEEDITFNATGDKTVFGISANGKVLSQGNFKLSGTIGVNEANAKKTSGSFKLFGGVQGEAFSR
jgi:hypothetical protein